MEKCVILTKCGQVMLLQCNTTMMHIIINNYYLLFREIIIKIEVHKCLIGNFFVLRITIRVNIGFTLCTCNFRCKVVDGIINNIEHCTNIG